MCLLFKPTILRKKFWAHDRIWTHNLPNTRRTLYPLSSVKWRLELRYLNHDMLGLVWDRGFCSQVYKNVTNYLALLRVLVAQQTSVCPVSWRSWVHNELQESCISHGLQVSHATYQQMTVPHTKFISIVYITMRINHVTDYTTLQTHSLHNCNLFNTLLI